ncbi:carbohydrate-binding domain-containing protein [Propioniciclava coleopterorum]|uniref:carbohydrate-binding domain-containing protein n=1 Tax=Propioniciclava coleopterorum TaxID=2714937 RepID=UPI003D73A799
MHSDSVVSIADGTLLLAGGDDGIHAEADVTIAGRSVTITRSEEGIEGNDLTLSGGTIAVTSRDDGLNVSAAEGAAASGGAGGGPGGGGETVIDGRLTISGGTVTIDAEGDGLDSNGDAVITGGTVVVWGPTGAGNGALDVNGAFTLSGGTLLAAGSAGMAETPDADSPQGWLQAAIGGVAGDTITIAADGAEPVRFTSPKAFANVVHSAPGMTAGTVYAVTVGAGATSVTAGEATAGGAGAPGGRGGGAGTRPGR